MKSLIEIGKNLTTLPTKTEKTSILRMRLNLINKNLPARVWLPLNSDIPHHVVRITEEKTAVLNSKDKTPYIIYVEVVEVNDIYTSPVIPKLMPSLRHTKSEEHLESNITSSTTTTTTSGTTTTTVSGTTTTISPLALPMQTFTDNCNKISTTHDCTLPNVTDCTNKELKIHIEKCDSNFGGTMTSTISRDWSEHGITEDDVWSQEDDEITAQYLNLHHKKISERDAISQMSLDSIDSREQCK